MSFDVILPFFPKEFQALFSEPDVTDIMITNCGLVFVDRNGKLEEQHLGKLAPNIVRVKSYRAETHLPDKSIYNSRHGHKTKIVYR